MAQKAQNRRIPPRNTLRRRREPYLLAAAVALVAVGLAIILRTEGILLAIGFVGAAYALRLAPAVKARARSVYPRRGQAVYLAWLVAALGLSASFVVSGVVCIWSGHHGTCRAVIEIRITLIAAALYGLALAAVFITRRRSRANRRG